MKHALVTGSRGFVGRHMTQHLEQTGWQVTGIDLLSGGDVMKHIWSFTKRYDLVVHAAAQAPNRAGIDSKLAAFPYNVALDSIMMNWAMTTRQHRFVYLSSCAAYPAWIQSRDAAHEPFEEADIAITDEVRDVEPPFDVYGWTKLFGERMIQQVREAGVATHVVRPFSGYGEDQSDEFPMRAFAQRASLREDPFVIWGNANQVRDWIHIDDVVRGIMAIVDADEQSPVNLCTGVGTTMRGVVDLLIDRTDGTYRPQIVVDEKAPLGAFYRVGSPELLHTIYTPRVSIEEGTWRMMQ